MDSQNSSFSSSNKSFSYIKKDQKSVNVENQFGNISSYYEEEFGVYSELINLYLKDDKDLEHIIPLNTKDKESLLEGCENGILLCKLINSAVPDTIMEKAINKNQNKMNIFKIRENIRLAINSAKHIGCIMKSISEDLIQNKQIKAILGMIWQILRIKQISEMNLRNHPEIIKLKEEKESMEEFMALKPENFLVRWINYHLQKEGQTQNITNLTENLKDGNIYVKLLDQLQKNVIDKDKVLTMEQQQQKADIIIQSCSKLGMPIIINSEQLLQGKQKINLIFLTQLFTAKNGLKDEILTELEIKEFNEQNQDDEDDLQGSREERQFRLWVNSLNIEGVKLMNLFADIRVDVVLLKVMDKVIPGSIDWKKVEKNPNNRFKKIINANYAIKIAKEIFKLSLVGIGGQDLVDGNKKLTLSLIWQLVYKHTLQTLGNNNEKDLLNWANNQVYPEQFKTLYDKTIKDCKLLYKLLQSISKNSFDASDIQQGEDEEVKINNAKYFLSSCRKLGATIFLVHEDILEVRQKMMLVLFAELKKIYLHGPSESTQNIIGQKIDC